MNPNFWTLLQLTDRSQTRPKLNSYIAIFFVCLFVFFKKFYFLPLYDSLFSLLPYIFKTPLFFTNLWIKWKVSKSWCRGWKVVCSVRHKNGYKQLGKPSNFIIFPFYFLIFFYSLLCYPLASIATFCFPQKFYTDFNYVSWFKI